MKLYTLGDSWTENGDFYKDRYYPIYAKPYNKPWTDQLAEYLNLELVNRGKGGTGPQAILYRFICLLNEIEVNSIVVISMSAMTRITIPFFTEDGIFKSYDVHAQEQKERFSKKKTSFMDPFNLDMYFDAKKYSVNVVHELYGNYFKFYSDQFKNILLFLKSSKNIKFLFWNWDYAVSTNTEDFYINRVIDHTKGKVNDLHPSVEGHSQLFNYFKDALNSNVEYLWF